MRRGKKKGEYTSLKSIGVKSVDETFKVAVQPLRDATDLRDAVQVRDSTVNSAVINNSFSALSHGCC